MANLPDDPIFSNTTLSFVAVAGNYLFDYERLNFDDRGAKVAILQPPTHGQLTALVKGSAAYKPDLNFYGQDKAVALVELGGYQVKVVYFIKIQPKGSGGVATDNEEVIKRLCGPKGRVWKISATPAVQYGANLQDLFDCKLASLNQAGPNTIKLASFRHPGEDQDPEIGPAALDSGLRRNDAK